MEEVFNMKKRKSLVLSLFLISLFLVPGFVSAQDYKSYSPLNSRDAGWGSPVVQYGNAWDPITDMFTGWTTGDLSKNVAKYLFTLLIFVIIFSVSAFIPFLRTKGVRTVFSVLVAFLSVAYLAPDELYVLLASYSALGLTLGTIVPFVILFAFMYSSVSKGGSAVFYQYFTWIAYAVWMVYKAIMFWIGGGPEGWEVPNSLMAVHMGLTLLAVTMVIANKPIRKFLFKAGLESKEEDAEMDIEKRAKERALQLKEWESRTAADE